MEEEEVKFVMDPNEIDKELKEFDYCYRILAELNAKEKKKNFKLTAAHAQKVLRVKRRIDKICERDRRETEQVEKWYSEGRYSGRKRPKK